MSERDYTIRFAKVEDVPAICEAFKEMTYSRLHDLGPGFVRVLHRHIVTCPDAVCLVAEADGQVFGYVSDTVHTGRFVRGFILKYGLWAGIVALPYMFRPRNLRTVIRALTFFPEDRFGKQECSGLAFAVRKDMKRRGAGRALWAARNEEYVKRGIESFTFMTAGEPTAAANAFYKSLGCEFLGTQPFYKDTVASVYRVDCTKDVIDPDRS
jgi:ribosomal protein S18 acetylase RimI-like enzyme